MRDCYALVLAAALLLPNAAAAQATNVNLGDLVLVVSDSPTAQVFHIVDQLSEWDQYAHKQYGRWAARALALTQEDRMLLQQHAALRRGRGWGKGFEQGFLVDATIERAAREAVAAGWLSADEAASERAILEHFAPKLAPLLTESTRGLDAFRSRLVAERERLLPLVQRLSRFSKTAAPLTVPVFLVSNPDDQNGGGEANGGRIVIEVPTSDPMGFLFHEALHAFLGPHADAIRAAAASAGLEFTTLNEGIAYALAPGLTNDGGPNDPLADQLARFLRARTPPTDAYVQFNTVAAVIRPLLRQSLDRGETIEAFLPKAVAKWKEIAPR